MENQQTHNRIFYLNSIFEHIIIFPLELAFKSNNKWRKIHHLYYSLKKLVNDNISKTFGTIKYTMINKAIETIINLSLKTMLTKKDFANAFRHIPIIKSNWWLLEFMWQKQCWIDRFLFFELKTFPFLFNLFVKNINWVVCKKKWQCIYYLNDFLIFISFGDDCQMYEESFTKLCKQLDINIKIKKNSAGLIAIFLNIELNIVNMTVHLSANKQKTALEKINAILKSKTIAYEILKSLVGLLFFTCKMIVFEKLFLRHFYDALTASEWKHHLKMGKTLKIDFLWSNEFY